MNESKIPIKQSSWSAKKTPVNTASTLRTQTYISQKALDQGYDPILKTIEPKIKKKKSKADF